MRRKGGRDLQYWVLIWVLIYEAKTKEEIKELENYKNSPKDISSTFQII
jgi:hypothetical protein